MRNRFEVYRKLFTYPTSPGTTQVTKALVALVSKLKRRLNCKSACINETSIEEYFFSLGLERTGSHPVLKLIVIRLRKNDQIILILQPNIIIDLWTENSHVTFVYKIWRDKEDSNKNYLRRKRGLRGHVILYSKVRTVVKKWNKHWKTGLEI